MRKIRLADKYPEIAAQAVDVVMASELPSTSPENIEWRCEKGHVYTASVVRRTQKGSGCPYCSGRYAIPGETDIATTRPDLAAELVDQSLATRIKAVSGKPVEWCCPKGHIYKAAPAQRSSKGSSCPYCSGRKAYPGETDLATTHPELAVQLVDKSLATKIKAGTNKKVEWECEQGHRWFVSPNSRTQKGVGCPYCAGKHTVVGETDLATLRPDLAAELVDQSLATELTLCSNRVVRWRCKKGHEWDTSACSRVARHTGCPYCAGTQRIVGENDLATVAPELAAELVDQSLATKLSPYSHQKVRWRCSEGHEWDSIVEGRYRDGHGCPECNARRYVSGGENEMAEYIESLIVGCAELDIVRNTRSVLSHCELDVYIPQLQIAFEYNGVYWHSTEVDGLQKHLRKMQMCKSQDIRVVNVWEDDWQYHRNVAELLIRQALMGDESLSENKLVTRVPDDLSWYEPYVLSMLDENDLYIELVDSMSHDGIALLGGHVFDGTFIVTTYFAKQAWQQAFLLLADEWLKQYAADNSVRHVEVTIDLSYEDGVFLSAAGFRRVKEISPELLYVGRCTNEARVKGSLLTADERQNCRTIKDCGHEVWRKDL